MPIHSTWSDLHHNQAGTNAAARMVIPPDAVVWFQQRGYIGLTVVGMADDAFLNPLVVAMRDQNGEEWRALVYDGGHVERLVHAPRRGCAWPYALRGWGATAARPWQAEVDNE